MTQSQLILSRYLYTIQIFNNGGGVGGHSEVFYFGARVIFAVSNK